MIRKVFFQACLSHFFDDIFFEGKRVNVNSFTAQQAFFINCSTKVYDIVSTNELDCFFCG